MAPALVEPVQTSHVVEVTVGRHGDDRAVAGEGRQLGPQVPDPVAGVHHHVPVPTAEVPDVRLEERVQMVLDQQREVRTDRRAPEPPLRDWQIHQIRSVKKTDAGAGRRQWTETIEAL
jgi:hypothetical protein